MKLLEMSISAGVLIILLTLIRMMGFSKLSKRMFVLLWIIVLIRLILPISLPMKNGIATPVLQFLQNGLNKLHHMGGSVDTGLGSMQKAVASAFKDNVENNMLRSGEISLAVYAIWMTGVVGFSVYFAYFFVKEYRMLAQAIPLQQVCSENGELSESYDTACRLVDLHKNHNRKGQLLIYDRIQSPLVWGVVRQRIVYPKNLKNANPSQIQYMLTHEMVHMKRRDNLWKLLSAAVVCIHWFNPMVWVMYLLLARDLELSCDEHVLALYGSKSREEYAMTLLSLVQNQNGRTLFCSGFEKNPTKERIVAIMNYKKLTKTGIFSAALLLAGAVTVFASNDKAAASGSSSQENVPASSVKAADYLEVSEKERDDESDLVYYTVVELSDDEKSGKRGKKKSGEKDTEDIVLHIIDGENGNEGLTDGNYYIEVGDIESAQLDKADDGAKAPEIVNVDGKKYSIKNIRFIKD